jgi:dCMP deaminase
MVSKNWSEYFMEIAKTVSTNSKCYSRQVGAVLVKDKSIISTGYNGPPRGVGHCITPDGRPGCPRKALGYKSGEGLQLCPAGHGERNAIVNAARMGIKVSGTRLYCNCGLPCKDCMIEIINAGIKEIVTISHGIYDELSKRLLKESGIRCWCVTDGKSII